MASMSYDQKNKRWLIQFRAPTGKRKSVTMKATRGRDRGEGKAAVMKNHIEDLNTAVRSGTTASPMVAAWVAQLSEAMHAQLVDAGLVERRLNPELAKLGPFLRKWFADRDGTKRSTVLTWRNAERNPKPWQNMRATRATELENEFGAHKATEWCGHTEKIAKAHYWMVTPDAVSEAAGLVSDAHMMQSDAEQARTAEPVNS